MSGVKVRRHRLQRVAEVFAVIAIACAAGCHRAKPVSQAEQIREALNTFYAGEPACLWQTPIALTPATKPPDGIVAEEARALLAASLIGMAHGSFALTGTGRAAWRSDPDQPGRGNLCFGTWRVQRIVSMTPRHDDLFGDVVETQYDATVPAAAPWTRLSGMQQAFPLMAMEVSQALPHSATMKHADKGWQVAAAAVPSVR